MLILAKIAIRTDSKGVEKVLETPHSPLQKSSRIHYAAF